VEPEPDRALLLSNSNELHLHKENMYVTLYNFVYFLSETLIYDAFDNLKLTTVDNWAHSPTRSSQGNPFGFLAAFTLP
jgi:hypothetical protein